ncbi:MAG: RidA family protein [Acidaminococcaceae bacterium]|nr:RidA family protein [Acidaminococcaceae bacterium]MDD4722655.1 RidA family protein [Acidaminococcaceae bacterium]
MKTEIKTTKAPQAIGPYSQAIEAQGFLFASGQIPLFVETGEVMQGTIEEQTHLVLDNIGEILRAKGLGYDSVVKTTVFLTDLADFAAVNGVYGTYFQEAAPARSCVQVAALPKGVKIEIEIIAACK